MTDVSTTTIILALYMIVCSIITPIYILFRITFGIYKFNRNLSDYKKMKFEEKGEPDDGL